MLLRFPACPSSPAWWTRKTTGEPATCFHCPSKHICENSNASSALSKPVSHPPAVLLPLGPDQREEVGLQGRQPPEYLLLHHAPLLTDCPTLTSATNCAKYFWENDFLPRDIYINLMSLVRLNAQRVAAQFSKPQGKSYGSKNYRLQGTGTCCRLGDKVELVCRSGGWRGAPCSDPLLHRSSWLTCSTFHPKG